jgi:hypothetical protein
MTADELEPRPYDARPAHGDSFVPWYKPIEHVHVLDVDGKPRPTGAHVFAASYEEAKKRAKYLIDRFVV